MLNDPNTRAIYSNTAKAVKRAARNDKRKYFESIAQEAEDAAGANNMRKLYQVISRLSNQKFKSNKGIKDKNEVLLTNVEQQSRRWKQHFEEISNAVNDEEEETPNTPPTLPV